MFIDKKNKNLHYLAGYLTAWIIKIDFVYSIKIKVMKKEAKRLLVRMLKNELTHAEKLWEENEVGHAYIVGYLTGIIKTAIRELDN